VTDAWMPGATRIWSAADGGPLHGGAPRVVWQTLGADPRTASARSAAHRLDRVARPGHLVWNPLQGEVVQLVPILRAGRLLGLPEDLGQLVPGPRLPGGDELAEVNAEGRLCVQIGVVAFAWDPFTSWPMSGLEQILDWLDSWGIPRQWPAGPPLPFPHGLTACGSRRLWARGGHFGASQVPGLTTAGPGGIDIERLTGPARRPGEAGRQAAAATVPGVRGLDRYLGHEKAPGAGALSRVG
jgi:hypothetical protein